MPFALTHVWPIRSFRVNSSFKPICPPAQSRVAYAKSETQTRKGFTLVELIVVIVILGILAAIAIPALTGYIDKAQYEGWKQEGRQYTMGAQTVISEYWGNHTVYTGTLSVNENGLGYYNGQDAVLARDSSGTLMFKGDPLNPEFPRFPAGTHDIQFSPGDPDEGGAYYDDSGYHPPTVACGLAELYRYTDLPAMIFSGSPRYVCWVNSSGSIIAWGYCVSMELDSDSGRASGDFVYYDSFIENEEIFYDPGSGFSVWHADTTADPVFQKVG